MPLARLKVLPHSSGAVMPAVTALRPIWMKLRQLDAMPRRAGKSSSASRLIAGIAIDMPHAKRPIGSTDCGTPAGSRPDTARLSATAANITGTTDTPKHILRTWANYRLPGELEKLSVGAGVNAQSSTLSFDRSFAQAGFAIWNSRVAYDASDEVTLAVNLNNVFDKKYFIPSYAQLVGNNYYGDPRNMMFSVTYKPQF